MNIAARAAALRATFDAPAPSSIGIEEELMLLDLDSAELAPAAETVLARLEGDARFRMELPASQLEVVLPPQRTVADAVALLGNARRDLAAATGDLVQLAAAGAHPTSPAEGDLNRGPRYERTEAEFGMYARRQLVFALHIHVALGSAEASLAVYNAVRSFLPEIAALAANAPFHVGRDTGLASVRPKIAEALPRQGVPPPLASWEAYAEALAWGQVSGAVPEPAVWWWEARLHPGFGTIELRVPDAQSSLAEAAGVAAFVHCLLVNLHERHAAGEQLTVAESWRIAENRWLAARGGVTGELVELDSGRRVPTARRLAGLVEELRSTAARLGCGPELDLAHELIAENGAMRQRRFAAKEGVQSLPAWLVERYRVPDAGTPEPVVRPLRPRP